LGGEGEWSVSCPGLFIPCERVPVTHWIIGWERKETEKILVMNPGGKRPFGRTKDRWKMM
jgi:hypothetical protein